MKLLYVADGRSPIARSWIGHFTETGHEVHLISSRPAQPLPGLASLSVVSIAFGGLEGRRAAATADRRAAADHADGSRPWWSGAAAIGLRSWLRHWLGPFTVPAAGRRIREIVDRLRPDLVHGLRVPFEAAAAAAANADRPLVVSTWGNDFTLHAPASPFMRRMTRRTMRRAGALLSDCQRDLRLASQWGFEASQPSLVLPGNGGVRQELFHAGPPGQAEQPKLVELLRLVPPEAPVLVNPRGFRGYVRNDSFFRAVPLILQAHPAARFLCPAMAGERQAERWIRRTGSGGSVHLLPPLSPADMAVVMRRAQVMLSPSEHDGTPNTLLEAMACGAYPVLGRLESVAEWIEDGVNGTLVDPARPADLAEAAAAALADPQRRNRAAEINQQLIRQRGDYAACMVRAERFYEELVGA